MRVRYVLCVFLPRLLCRLELSCESFVQGTACRASSAGAVRRAAPHGVPLCTAARQSAGQGPAFVLGVAHTAASPPPPADAPCPPPPSPNSSCSARVSRVAPARPCSCSHRCPPPRPPSGCPLLPPTPRMPPVPPPPPSDSSSAARASSVVLPFNPCPPSALPSALRGYPSSASRYYPRGSRTACTRTPIAGTSPGAPRRGRSRRGDGIEHNIEASVESPGPPLMIFRHPSC